MFRNFMLLAIDMAKQAVQLGEVPIGAVLVNNRRGALYRACNLVQTCNNPLLHAEFLVIREAIANREEKFLHEFDLYVTLEPCYMCACAISLSRIGRVFYAVQSNKFGALSNDHNFFSSPQCFYRPEVYPDLGYHEYEEILRDSFCKMRKNDV
ncbi:tRNA-specific adenosine deaminase [Rickettsiales endosymbiont of Paramecium tredecaurelia]|uniref:nucleoside deaminase n=1 Tax=Candidatus Sarmatiella mevalonica TaxID=2770581 RepID=UPI0019246B6B|nr:nucleoside deaminase [Candidatus Sarmatiella mevalonica]MBL3284318.1 tRNA-specific adenosine deaminase [Candidatus Sarmatiella mevalonica]